MPNHNKLMVVLTFPKSKRGAEAYNLESYKCLCPQKLRQILHRSILPEFSVPCPGELANP